MKNSEAGTGFNAATGEWVNMIDAEFIESVKVTRSLQNAASVASLILTTEAVVANQPEPASPTPAMDPSMMGGMMHFNKGFYIVETRLKAMRGKKGQKIITCLSIDYVFVTIINS